MSSRRFATLAQLIHWCSSTLLFLTHPNDSNTLNENDDELTLAEKALKDLNTKIGQEIGYMDTRFIVLTSNLCERLFPVSGLGLSARRKT